VYKALSESYANKFNEISMVENLCSLLNDQSSSGIHIYAEKIHGPKSYVNFSMQGRLICKELADMVILSIATKDQAIVYEKTAFVQHKKEKCSGKWSIDREQLFLLRNFPTITGVKGIINKSFPHEKIAFLNFTGSLGNYGLFQYPGEIILTIASEVASKLSGGIIEYSKIAKDSVKYSSHSLLQPSLNIGDYVIFSGNGGTYQAPILQNASLSINSYEFVRNFTQFNIGEPVVYIEKKPTNPILSQFNRFLLKNTSLGGKLGIDFRNDDLPESEIEGDINLLCVHFAL
jgi:hypothetical protein